MKKLFLIALALTSAAHAETPIATCHNKAEGLILCIYTEKSETTNWRAVRVDWSKASKCQDSNYFGVTLSRTFINEDIKQNDAAAISARQGGNIFGGGNQSHLYYDAATKTAEIWGKNTTQITLNVSDEPSAPGEKKGKWDIKFFDCE